MVRTDDTANPIHAVVNLLLADSVVAASVVVGRILLAADHVLGVEQRAERARPDLIDGGRVQVEEDRPGDVFAVAGLGEEGLVRATLGDVVCVRVGPAVRAEAMLQKVAVRERSAAIVQRGRSGADKQLPGVVTKLDASLAQVNVEDLARAKQESVSNVARDVVCGREQRW